MIAEDRPCSKDYGLTHGGAAAGCWRYGKQVIGKWKKEGQYEMATSAADRVQRMHTAIMAIRHSAGQLPVNCYNCSGGGQAVRFNRPSL